MRPLLALLLAAAPALAQEPSLIGSVVRSKKYTVRRGEHKVEELEGDVQYRQGGRKLSSDWALYDHDAQRMEARGHVRAEDRLEDGRTILAEGERAQYERGKGAGWMTGEHSGDPVRLTLFDADGLLEGRGHARRLSWNLSHEQVSLEGDAWFVDPRGEVWADKARFLHDARRLELSGRRPVLVAVGPTWQASVQADAVTATALEGARRRVTGIGRAHGWLHFPPKEGLNP